jgi:hypothetical protein
MHRYRCLPIRSCKARRPFGRRTADGRPVTLGPLWEVPTVTYIDPQSIQSGWTVVGSDGKELGTVIGTEGSMIQVKKNGLLGGTLSVPRDAVAEMETGRVELSMTREELEAATGA